MSKVSKRIEIPDTEALRVRQDGDRLELVLIDKSGAVQLVPVKMDPERTAAQAA